jgi:hypothetical protein
MLYEFEVNEIAEVARRAVYKEMASIEAKVAHDAGSFNYLLAYGGLTFFAHRPIPGAQIIRSIPHF